MKAQGTTEYLIILAVIIIISLVVVSVMGWFPGLGVSISEQESQAYWRSAHPFAIKYAYLSGNSIKLQIQNNSSERLTLTTVKVGSVSGSVGVGGQEFGPGEERIIQPLVLGMPESPLCPSQTRYSFEVELTYNTPTLTGKIQKGAKPLVGTCD